MAGSNRNDFKVLRETIESIAIERARPTVEREQGMCLDKGYDYDEGSMRDPEGVWFHGPHPRPGRRSARCQTRSGL